MLESQTSARTPGEVWERGLPKDGDVVVWGGPYKFYRMVKMMGLDGEVSRRVVAEFTVKTNHPAVSGLPRKRSGLYEYVYDEGKELELRSVPGNAVILRAVLIRAGKAPEDLSIRRPDIPEFPNGMVRCTHCESLDVEKRTAKVVVEDGCASGVVTYRCEACRKEFEVSKGEQGVLVCPLCGEKMHDNSFMRYGEVFVPCGYCAKCKRTVNIEGIESEEEMASIS